MNYNESILFKFFKAFENVNAIEMCACYHPKIQFNNPIFGSLTTNEVCDMWQMLMDSSVKNLKINFSEIQANEYIGTVQWIARYNFGKKTEKLFTKFKVNLHLKRV
jgi:hypothetical protein